MLLNDEMNTSYQPSEALLAEHRPVLFRYALLQLKDTELADDAVQETLLAAWQASAPFALTDASLGLRRILLPALQTGLPVSINFFDTSPENWVVSEVIPASSSAA